VSDKNFFSADIRLRILQVLEDDVDYSHNEDVIRGLLAARTAHQLSRDRLRTELYWLAEQGAVSVDDRDNLLVAKLTARGEDVALGRTRVPGINRPRPE